MVSKKPKYDLRILHAVFAETGMIISLLLMIGIIHLPIAESENTFIPSELAVGPPLVLPPTITAAPVLVPPPPIPDVPIQIPDDIPITGPELKFDEFDINKELELPPLEEEIEIVIDHDRLKEIEVLPSMIGGEETFQNAIDYPRHAIDRGIEGIVEVEFYIDKEGRVVDPVIIKGIGGGCDEEVLSAIRKQRYHPGIKNGEIAEFKLKETVQFIIVDLN